MTAKEKELFRTIEAILFATGEPVTYMKLSELLELTVKKVKGLTAEMQKEYDDRGIQLICYDNSCQLCTKEEYEGIIKDALGIKKNGALSKSCLETVAIIAYNQPVTRTFVEEVRGVDSSYAINMLLTRELIEIKGRLDVPGRPNLYATTENFLRVFGLNSISDLPGIEVLKMPAPEDETAESEENTESSNAEAQPESEGELINA